jgi:hypothetical protein
MENVTGNVRQRQPVKHLTMAAQRSVAPYFQCRQQRAGGYREKDRYPD